MLAGNEEKFMANSTYVYQRGDRKGVFKVHKNMRDVFPIFYSIQKWKSYIKNADFYLLHCKHFGCCTAALKCSANHYPIREAWQLFSMLNKVSILHRC